MVSELRQRVEEQWSRVTHARIAESIAGRAHWSSRPLLAQTFDSRASFRVK